MEYNNTINSPRCMQTNVTLQNTSRFLFGSMISSVTSTLLTNPFQVAKLHSQFLPLSCPSYPHRSYAQLAECTCSRLSFEGTLRSLKVALPQSLFNSVIFMQLYQHTRSLLTTTFSSIHSTFLASLSTRLIVTSINVPIEVMRVRLSNSLATASNFFTLRGFKATLARDLTYSLIYWNLFEFARTLSTKGQDYRTLTLTHWDMIKINFAPSLFVSAIASLCTTPFDVIKTRRQSQIYTKLSILQQLRTIYNQQHIHGLFSGGTYRTVKNGLYTSLYITLFQLCVQRNKSIL